MYLCSSKVFRLVMLLIGAAFLFEGAYNISLAAESWQEPVPLDPTAGITSPVLESVRHQPLPEQYIWTPATDSGDLAQVRYFRTTFTISEGPAKATLYVAGPNDVAVYLNGKLLGNLQNDPASKAHPFVFFLDVSRQLKVGQNILALRVSQGKRLAVKIVPRGPEQMAPALVISSPDWKCSIQGDPGWLSSGFNDSSWQPVTALGSIEGDIDFFQWNSDANMYRWPGYDGISPFLAQVSLAPSKVIDTFEGLGHFKHLDALTGPVNLSPGSEDEFEVNLPSTPVPGEERPSLVLDFGRETVGRLEVVSDSSEPVSMRVSYGESLGEALHEPYLGPNPIYVPSHGKAYGPKSAFRYVRVQFLNGSSPVRLKTIRIDAIYYPVKYEGAFESSDPLLNRIWAVGAYTAHLCMQDDIWDAPKRDRGRWMGDLDVSGRVIDTVFADRFLMQDTLDRLIQETGRPVHRDVNTIPGYSAFWVMGEADYYRHTGDSKYLHSVHEPLIQLLTYMESELNQSGLFVNARRSWPFVDWSPDLNGDTAEARRATTFEFYKAFSDGAWLLRQDGDRDAAARFQKKANEMKAAARKYLLDPRFHTFGTRHQTNAMAIFSGVATHAQTTAIWRHVLSRPQHFRITPYYDFYVITAMAKAGHRKEALDLIREYWGGMVKEGATSFWEAYDPRWSKTNFHRHLRADNGQGYFVSLSHGWSSGATAWLTEQVLGIQPLEPGFRKVLIRMNLADLKWARGAEPTPHGLILVDYRRVPKGLEAQIDLPQGVSAQVSVPATTGETSVMVNGSLTKGSPAENGKRLIVRLEHGGHYRITPRT